MFGAHVAHMGSHALPGHSRAPQDSQCAHKRVKKVQRRPSSRRSLLRAAACDRALRPARGRRSGIEIRARLQRVARPNPTPAPAAALMPPPATPALMGPRTRSGETSAGETSAAGALVPAPDSKEYWMAKSKLVSEAARDLFAAGRKMHERPLTLKATHPAWQVKKAEATHEDPAQVARVRRAAERLGLGQRARGLRARKSCSPARARR